MPTCAIEGCKNSSKKKFKMNSLPRNPVQRALWMKSIGRPNWVPKENEAVCEVHFPPEMWEKTRVDGTRKLKYNAVPTIFDNQIINESPNLHFVIPPEGNQNDINFLISDEQTVIQILPANWLNLQQTQSVIPTSSTSSSVNSKSVSNKAKSISILKPQIKMKNLQAVMSSNTSSLTREKVKNRDQKKIIISRSSDGSEVKSINLSHSLQLNDINVSNVTEIETNGSQAELYPVRVDEAINLSGSIPITKVRIVDVTKTAGNQSILIPKVMDSNNTNYLETQAIDLTEDVPIANINNTSDTTEMEMIDSQPVLIPMSTDSVNSKTQVIKFQKTKLSKTSERMESSDQQKSEGFVSSGIILNKAEAKKREDERFEKMDKLLLKQLKLNNALRNKLIVLRARMQRIMKKQHDSNSTSFLKKAFTNDQIRVLQTKHLNSKSITAWSDNTMLKAITLKRACGLRGYEEILNQNLPYPCFRTIKRWCTARNIEIP